LWNSNSSFRFWWYTSCNTGATEEYDGNSWTILSLNTARRAPGGIGTQTSALAFGGATPPPVYQQLKNIMVQVGHPSNPMVYSKT
jgi:hypothetical protein